MKDPIKLSSEVEINQSDILILDDTWIEKIKEYASRNNSGKYRTCIHTSEKDNVHEMLIALTKESYIRPHKHKINGESLQFIYGNAVAIIFNQDGSINNAFRVGKPLSGLSFYYSMAKSQYHMLVVESDFLVFTETTKGPFMPENTIFPSWAPDGKDKTESLKFNDKILKLLDNKGLLPL